jgi:hypothetical protein
MTTDQTQCTGPGSLARVAYGQKHPYQTTVMNIGLGKNLAIVVMVGAGGRSAAIVGINDSLSHCDMLRQMTLDN